MWLSFKAESVFWSDKIKKFDDLSLRFWKCVFLKGEGVAILQMITFDYIIKAEQKVYNSFLFGASRKKIFYDYGGITKLSCWVEIRYVRFRYWAESH